MSFSEAICQISRMEEELLAANNNIESLVKVARNIKTQVNPELHKFLEIIIEEVSNISPIKLVQGVQSEHEQFRRQFIH